MRVEKAGDADDGVQFQERESDGGIIEIHLACAQRLLDGRRQSIGIHFQPDGKRGGRAYAGADAAELCSFDGLMQMELAAPKSLVAESIEAKRLAALRDQF